MKFHTLTICGLKRSLPIKAVGKTTKLANLSILGDVALVEKVAETLHTRLKDYTFDYIVGPESKVVPLLHELSKRLEIKRYVVCRKSVKPYMVSPLILDPKPHFPKHVKRLVLDGRDAQLLKGSTVAIVDDVISTGVTLRMVQTLINQAGATISVVATIIRQGDHTFDDIDNHIYLETLPIFKNTS